MQTCKVTNLLRDTAQNVEVVGPQGKTTVRVMPRKTVTLPPEYMVDNNYLVMNTASLKVTIA